MLETLDKPERMRLMRFICSFAWADFEVQSPERKFIEKIMKQLHLGKSEKAQVTAWLESPPDPDDVDPTEIPREHRKLFLKTVEQLLTTDRKLQDEELDTLYVFRKLLI